MKKFLLILFLLYTSANFAQNLSFDKVRGFFIAFDVGPEFPIGSFAGSTNLGYGFNVEFSYADNQVFPFFLYGKIGFDQFPGAQSFYEVTDYSNFSTNILPVSIGARYYFRPLVKNVVLFMPVLEASANYAYVQTLNQFKFASGKNNYISDVSKFGFTVGAGFSMFLMEIVADYNYFYTNQYISIELRVRLPLYISL